MRQFECTWRFLAVDILYIWLVLRLGSTTVFCFKPIRDTLGRVITLRLCFKLETFVIFTAMIFVLLCDIKCFVRLITCDVQRNSPEYRRRCTENEGYPLLLEGTLFVVKHEIPPVLYREMYRSDKSLQCHASILGRRRGITFIQSNERRYGRENERLKMENIQLQTNKWIMKILKRKYTRRTIDEKECSCHSMPMVLVRKR